ncbi:MAG TPA: tetratricopeptide repeat protein [Cyclobacteriaceae bacterium]|jgi:tetratricopeptide (TPR) repeat protein|nr:tetratricopeptide repeat protein [Cyclobacteriaceae bacterium]
MFIDPTRLNLAKQISQVIAQNQMVIVGGQRGLGQKSVVAAGLVNYVEWEHLRVDGNGLTGGYLAGFQEIIDTAFRWCDKNRPEIISRHEQSIKRMFPLIDSPRFTVPKDLTNTSSSEERTRFYHHEYQNKLLVGLSRFLIEYLEAAAKPVLLIIDNASSMSPTALALLQVFLRNRTSFPLIKFILLDYERQIFNPDVTRIDVPEYCYPEMAELLKLEQEYAREKAQRIYTSSHGNPMMARAIIACERQGLPVTGYINYNAMVDLYLATLQNQEREELVTRFIAQNCESDDYIEKRNYETFDTEFKDSEHLKRHSVCMAEYKAGISPLNTFHAQAIKNKFTRLAALVEPSEILKSIGLYDTWFSYFGELFSDQKLRQFGSGDDPANAAFINAAFVLYSLGCARASAPFLDEFYEAFPKSKFIPTVLYAQAMTYGRYRQPVDLPKAERYALLNIRKIEENFHHHSKYHYIKVFAENAYAYIKARQGKYQEALTLCMNGNRKMLEVYGDHKFKLHQSILIYNTSQVYEIVKDYELAETQLRLAISYDPYYGEYHNDLGNLLSQIVGRAEEALSSYDTAIALCPPYYEAYLNRGVLNRNLGNRAEAKKDFELALEIKPKEWRAFLELGNMHLAQGQYETAIQMYDNAIAIEPLNVELQNNSGLACSECGNSERSIIHYRRAIALNPRHADSHNNLAVELFRTNQRDESLEHAIIATEIGGDPDFETNLSTIREFFATARIT